MKRLVLFFCSAIFLLCFHTLAFPSALECEKVFQSDSDKPFIVKGLMKQKPTEELNGNMVIISKSSPDDNLQVLVKEVPVVSIAELDLKKLNPKWKKDMMFAIHKFQMPHLWKILDHLFIISKQLDLNVEKEFFKSVLEASQPFINTFNKEQLIKIMWKFTYWNIQPSEEFFNTWQQVTLEKRREFTSMDRAGLRGFFKRLGIQAPYRILSNK